MKPVPNSIKVKPLKDLKNEWLGHVNDSNDPCPFYVTTKVHKKGTLISRPLSAQNSYMLAAESSYISKNSATSSGLNFEYRMANNTSGKKLEALTVSEPIVLVPYDFEACYPSMYINYALSILHQNVP